jgi:hypothetical protein
MSDRVFQLKATILETRPPVWRRVLVGEDTTLAQLHEVLQAAFGWWNYHLHEFEIDGVRYGIDDGEDWEPPEDERTARLRDLLQEGSSFLYVYDFSDYWQHRIVVEKRVPADARRSYPICTDGRRACPPEDCGGPWGFREFLDAIADRNHEEHDAMLEWVGGQYNPDDFDPAALEHRLKLGRLAAL